MLDDIVMIGTLAVLDGLWIGFNQSMYLRVFEKVQNHRVQVNFIGAILSYVFVLVLLKFIVLPLIKLKNDFSIMNCIKIAGLTGLCTYGVFNATNMALFMNYNTRIALMDTLWGGFLFTIVSYVVLNYHHLLR
jgi:uncharacterized membrane protein